MLLYSVVPDTESMYIKYKVHDVIRFPCGVSQIN